MSKRVLAVVLIVIGLLAIAGVLYWTFRPMVKERAATPSSPVVEALPAPTPQNPSPSVPPTPGPAPRVSGVEEQEQQLLLNKASAFAGRQGSYTNLDGFVGLRDVYLDVSPTVRGFYQAEQQRLNKEHPTAIGTWVQTTRALSSKITSELPIVGKNSAVVSVQVQQVVEAGTTPAVLSYRELIVTLGREQGRWIVTRIESKPLEL